MRLWILYIKNGFAGLGCSSAVCMKPWSLAGKNESVRERHGVGREGWRERKGEGQRETGEREVLWGGANPSLFSGWVFW